MAYEQYQPKQKLISSLSILELNTDASIMERLDEQKRRYLWRGAEYGYWLRVGGILAGEAGEWGDGGVQQYA